MSMTVHRGGMLTISGNQNDLVAKLNDEKNIEALQKKLTENEKKLCNIIIRVLHWISNKIEGRKIDLDLSYHQEQITRQTRDLTRQFLNEYGKVDINAFQVAGMSARQLWNSTYEEEYASGSKFWQVAEMYRLTVCIQNGIDLAIRDFQIQQKVEESTKHLVPYWSDFVPGTCENENIEENWHGKIIINSGEGEKDVEGFDDYGQTEGLSETEGEGDTPEGDVTSTSDVIDDNVNSAPVETQPIFGEPEEENPVVMKQTFGGPSVQENGDRKNDQSIKVERNNDKMHKSDKVDVNKDKEEVPSNFKHNLLSFKVVQEQVLNDIIDDMHDEEENPQEENNTPG